MSQAVAPPPQISQNIDPNQTAYQSPLIYGLISVRRHKFLICAIIIGIMVLAISILNQIPRKYTATAMITLNTPPIVVSIREVVQETAATPSTIQTHIDLLRSQALADQVVTKLNLTLDPEFAPSLSAESNSSWLFDWLIDAVKSDSQRELLSDDERQTLVIQNVLAHLRVIHDGQSYTIRVSFESLDPEKSAVIANAFVEAFLDNQLEAKFDATRRATAWLTQRLEQLRTKVRESEQSVEAYREQESLQEVRGDTIVGQQLTEINAQLIAARAARAEAEARLRHLRQLVAAGQAENSQEVLSAGSVQRLRERETELIRTAAELSVQYEDRHPRMIALRGELRDLRAQIESEVQRVVLALESQATVARTRESSLGQALAQMEAQLGQSARAEVRLNELKREAETDRTVLEAYLQRMKETAGQDELQRPDARLASVARPPVYPSSPNTVLFLGLSLFWSTCLGILIALAIDYSNRGVTSEEAIEQATGYPPLGVIPNLRYRSGRRISMLLRELRTPTSIFSEAIQSLRTNLRLMPDLKVCMITSSLPAEGKTTLAAGLALTVARSGSRVALIDADLRRPKVASLFGVTPDYSVYDALSGMIPVEKAFLKLENDNLWVLCSRTGLGRDHSPLNTLNSLAIHRMLQNLRLRFDLIIIDTPPVASVSDALLFAGASDLSVVVIRWKSTGRDAVGGVIRALYDAGSPCVRSVLSRVNIRRYSLYSRRASKYYSYYSSYLYR